jgi:hypothetical protein
MGNRRNKEWQLGVIRKGPLQKVKDVKCQQCCWAWWRQAQKTTIEQNKVLQNAQDLIASYYKVNRASQVIIQIIASTLSCFPIDVGKVLVMLKIWMDPISHVHVLNQDGYFFKDGVTKWKFMYGLV